MLFAEAQTDLTGVFVLIGILVAIIVVMIGFNLDEKKRRSASPEERRRSIQRDLVNRRLDVEQMEEQLNEMQNAAANQ